MYRVVGGLSHGCVQVIVMLVSDSSTMSVMTGGHEHFGTSVIGIEDAH